jgi:3-methyladenine DNA glycosylase AlkD
MLKELEEELKKYTKEERGKLLQRFFKTGPGQYGEGDVFLGLTMGEQRLVSKKFKDLEIKDVQQLLNSEIHEKRMISLLILIAKYKKASEEGKKEIFDFYIKNAKKVNNWDLVDVTSHKIVGDFLVDKDRTILYEFARSDNLWEKRISIISTFAFIRNNDFSDSLKIAEILLHDKHDLIHKAVGWMLREIGKKDQSVLESFLKKHYKDMPRTMLRYSIERFEESKRKKYLRGEI